MKAAQPEVFKNTEQLFSTLRQHRKKDPRKSTYLDNPNINTTNAIFEAVRQGDVVILEILLDPIHPDFYGLEQPFVAKKEKHQTELDILLRKQKIKETQLAILNSFAERITEYRQTERNLLEYELSLGLHHLLREYRLANQALLNQKKEMTLEGQVTTLSLATKVRLHKIFSLQLEQEFIETDLSIPSTQSGILRRTGKILKEMGNLSDALKDLSKKYENAFNALIRLARIKEKIVAAHSKKVSGLLQDLYQKQIDTNYTAKQIRSVTKLRDQPKFRLDGTDPATGDSLLHAAIQGSQFELAIYLLGKKISPTRHNHDYIAAIDAQDKKGDTLLHYAARIGDYATCYYLIEIGANTSIKNLSGQKAVDVVFQNQTLIHYLFKCHPEHRSGSQNTQELTHLNLLLNLLQTSFNIDQFLVNKIWLLDKVLSLPENIKKSILDAIRNGLRETTFHSTFRCNINFVLTEHLFMLFKHQSYSAISKIFSGVNTHNTEKQLKFLSNLQLLLNSEIDDSEFSRVLDTMLSSQSHLSGDQLAEYRKYLEIFSEESMLVEASESSLVKLNTLYEIVEAEDAGALNTQDLQGNTLLHSILKLKEYEYACQLIEAGASHTTQNKIGQTPIDVSENKGELLLTFLLRRIQDRTGIQRYLNTFLDLVHTTFNLSHFITNPTRKNSTFSILSNAPVQIKKIIFDELRVKYFNKKSKSLFRCHLNLVAWEHLMILMRRSLPDHFLRNNTNIIGQLNFLASLAKLLNSKKDDWEIEHKLEKILKQHTETFPRLIRLEYKRCINTFADEFNLEHGVKSTPTTSIENVNSFFQSATRPLKTLMKFKLHEADSEWNDSNRDLAALESPKSIDVFHWFTPRT